MTSRLPLVALFTLLAATAQASNTGFVKSLRLHAGAADSPSTNFVSVPYFYFPSGAVGEPQFAHDLLADFPAATSFARVNPATGGIESWDNLGGTWMGDDFPLEAAVGLAIAVATDGTASVAGSHDDSFAGRQLLARRTGPTAHLVAPPYHTRWETADDLLAEVFDGWNPLVVSTYRDGRYLSRRIDFPRQFSGENFALEAGEALELGIVAETSFLSPHWLTGGPAGDPPDGGIVGVTRFLDLHHPEGGMVLDAADGTPAAGARWRAASRVYGDTVVTSGRAGQGQVGAVSPGFWYGQVGEGLWLASDGLYRVQVGDDRLVAIDLEVAGEGAARRGYYAVTSKDITGSYPDLFAPVTLRPIPVPSARVRGPSRIELTWPAALEDAGLPARQNLAGYEVYRSADGQSFERIGEVPAGTTRFTDVAADTLRRHHYALRLVYRLGLRSGFLSARSACAGALCPGGRPGWAGTLPPVRPTVQPGGGVSGRVPDGSRVDP